MMPDLGKYAAEVLTAYGASLLLIAGIVAISLRRGARVRDALRAIEARQQPAAGSDARPFPAAAPAETASQPRADAPGTTPETRTHG